MPIYKLQQDPPGSWSGELVHASRTNIEIERFLESWLERSPWAVASEPLLWIGRQSAAVVPGGTIFPDLLGLDGEGNLVIVELKRGRAPRDVVAQLMEYAAWADELTEKDIHELARPYLSSMTQSVTDRLGEAFRATFETDVLPPLNQRMRLFIIAEEIPESVSRVARFLRTSHAMDISCVQFSAHRTKTGEIVVNSLPVVGQEDIVAPKRTLSSRWSGDKPVKEIVWDAVCELTKDDKTRVFAPREVSAIIRKRQPDFKITNVNPELIADCVNHTSRHHYPGGKDRYWWLGRGQYRLFDPSSDVPPTSTHEE